MANVDINSFSFVSHRCFACAAPHLREDVTSYLTPIFRGISHSLAVSRNCWQKYGEPLVVVDLTATRIAGQIRNELHGISPHAAHFIYLYLRPNEMSEEFDVNTTTWNRPYQKFIWFRDQVSFIENHRLIQHFGKIGEVAVHDPKTSPCPL